MLELIVYFLLLVAYVASATALWSVMYQGIKSGSTQLSRIRCGVWAAVVAFALITAFAGIVLRVYETISHCLK